MVAGGQQQNDFISELYDKYRDAVMRYCVAMLGGDEEDAYDCVQDVFEAAIKEQDKLMNHPNVVGWLKLAARNRANRIIRKKQKRRNTEISIGDESDRYEQALQYIERFEETALDDSEISKIKEQLLLRLTVDERRLYEMRFVEKKTFNEIAADINKSVNATRMRCVKLELKLRRMIDELGI